MENVEQALWHPGRFQALAGNLKIEEIVVGNGDARFKLLGTPRYRSANGQLKFEGEIPPQVLVVFLTPGTIKTGICREVLLSRLKKREPNCINGSLFLYILTMYLQLRWQRPIDLNIMVGRELI
jgi:hypothetical protein